MSDHPCDLSLARLLTTGAQDFVRIEAKDGLKVLARIDLSLLDYANLILGQEVTAAITTARTP